MQCLWFLLDLPNVYVRSWQRTLTISRPLLFWTQWIQFGVCMYAVPNIIIRCDNILSCNIASSNIWSTECSRYHIGIWCNAVPRDVFMRCTAQQMRRPHSMAMYECTSPAMHATIWCVLYTEWCASSNMQYTTQLYNIVHILHACGWLRMHYSRVAFDAALRNNTVVSSLLCMLHIPQCRVTIRHVFTWCRLHACGMYPMIYSRYRCCMQYAPSPSCAAMHISQLMLRAWHGTCRTRCNNVVHAAALDTSMLHAVRTICQWSAQIMHTVACICLQ
jgi:hypothetical protein